MSPTLASLLKDPAYKAYFLRAPRLPAGLHAPLPFKVWGLRIDNKWAGKAVPTFADGFILAKRMLRAKDQFRDVSISSRVIGFRAPEQLLTAYKADGYDWCIMCRRPVHFMPKRRHHALRPDLHQFFAHEPVCPYCGIREETVLTPGAVTLGKN